MLAIKEVSKLRGWKANAGFLTNKLIFHFIQCRDEWQAPCQSLNSSEPGWAPAFKEHTLVQAQGLPDPLGQWKEGAVCAQPAEATLESSRTPESVYSTVSFWIFIRKKCPILWHRTEAWNPLSISREEREGGLPDSWSWIGGGLGNPRVLSQTRELERWTSVNQVPDPTGGLGGWDIAPAAPGSGEHSSAPADQRDRGRLGGSRRS